MTDRAVNFRENPIGTVVLAAKKSHDGVARRLAI